MFRNELPYLQKASSDYLARVHCGTPYIRQGQPSRRAFDAVVTVRDFVIYHNAAIVSDL